MSTDWQRLRDEFPVLKDWVYLNTATFGPLPRCAAEAAAAHLRQRDETASLNFLDWYRDADVVRAGAAKLVGATADDIAFIPNAGAGLAWLIGGIDWKSGDEIVTFAHEFPNNLYFPKVLASAGVSLTELELPDGRFSMDRFLEALTPRTRLVLMSTVNYSTGLRPPIEAIGAELRNRNILFFVDGTQSVGALQMDVQAAAIDFLVVHAYKWLLSPTGIGFAYVAPAVREWLEPSVYSWRSHKNWRDVDRLHHGVPELPSSAIKYEGGMQNFGNIFAMGAVLNLIESIGPDAIEGRVQLLAEKTREVVRSRGGQLASDRHDHYDSPIVTAQFPKVDVSELAALLRDKGIAVAARKGSLRVSPHFFNNDDDLARLGEGLKIG